MLEIDGSIGEGGGQILRTTVSLSAITGLPVRIFNIRRNRPKPGLAAQHQTGIQAVGDLCDAEKEGLQRGSVEVTFRPGKIKGGYYRFDIGTAGSITLVLETVLPVALKASKKTTLEIIGGTDVKFAPPLDYFRYVIKPILEKSGARMEIIEFSRGYYPKGGGRLLLEINPVHGGTAKLELTERGELREIQGNIHSANIPGHVASRLKKTAEVELSRKFKYVPIKIGTEIVSRSASAGVGLTLSANFDNSVLGSSALGEKGIPAEKLAKTATETLFNEIGTGATVDKYAADQLLYYIADYGGGYCAKKPLTNHTITNREIIQLFFGDIIELADMGKMICIRRIKKSQN